MIGGVQSQARVVEARDLAGSGGAWHRLDVAHIENCETANSARLAGAKIMHTPSTPPKRATPITGCGQAIGSDGGGSPPGAV